MRIRGKQGRARGEGLRQGMTLVEVIFAMAVFSIMLCVFLLFQFSTLQAAGIASLQTSGTVALRSRMEQSVAEAYEKMMDGGAVNASMAQGLLSYLGDLRGEADVRLEEETSTIVYTFPVPLPGEALDGGSQNPDGNAVGTFTVYLREDSVPCEFVGWDNYHEGGIGSPNNDGFDMNGDTVVEKDFSFLFGGSDTEIEQSGLNSLPVQGEILYYNSADDKAHGRPAYSVFRNFIVNGDSVIPEKAGRYPDL